MYNLVVFSVFTKLYNHHHYLIPEHSVTPVSCIFLLCPFHRCGNRSGMQDAHPELTRELRGRAGSPAVLALCDGRPLKGRPGAGLEETPPLIIEQAGDGAASPAVTGFPPPVPAARPFPRSLVPGGLDLFCINTASPKQETVLKFTMYTVIKASHPPHC